MKPILIPALLTTTVSAVLLAACSQTQIDSAATDANEQTTASVNSSADASSYTGTASLTQGVAQTDVTNAYECDRGRQTNIGSIQSTDGKTWTVPAATNLLNTDFPVASDLNNPCTGNDYRTASEALAQLDGSDIIEVDADGEVYTAYVFADNYFEMYVNGVAVGRDNVPFTQFNSNIVRFKAKAPFTVAMHLVDWEENLGVGSESNNGSEFHAGDGGLVAVIKDKDNNIIAKTDETWKAQTFYTAPIRDLSCVSESGSERLSSNCVTTGNVQDGSADYGLHWELPTNWQQADFDDSSWPNATTYSNQTIGVDNKSAYTNFIDIFDNEKADAEFIWSTNVVLDNEVIVRYTVNGL